MDIDLAFNLNSILSLLQEWFQVVFTLPDLILSVIAFLIVLVLLALNSIRSGLAHNNRLSNQILVELKQLNSDIAEISQKDTEDNTNPL